MCLEIISKTPKRIKFINGKATVYKVVEVDFDGLYSIYQNYMYKPGFNKALGNINIELRDYYEEKDVEYLHGGAIHVCITKNGCKNHLGNRGHVAIPVTVYKKDFIAESLSEAAFTKIFISKANYKKALNSNNKQFPCE